MKSWCQKLTTSFWGNHLWFFTWTKGALHIIAGYFKSSLDAFCPRTKTLGAVHKRQSMPLAAWTWLVRRRKVKLSEFDPWALTREPFTFSALVVIYLGKLEVWLVAVLCSAVSQQVLHIDFPSSFGIHDALKSENMSNKWTHIAREKNTKRP